MKQKNKRLSKNTAKELKALSVLYGDIMTEEEISEKLKEHKGNILSAIGNIVEHKLKPEQINYTPMKKQVKVLQKLYGDLITEEELREKLTKYDGNTDLVIQEIVEIRTTSQRTDWTKKDPVYAQVVSSIEEISNPIEKSVELHLFDCILLYACCCANEGKEHLFLDILRRFEGGIDFTREFEMNGYKVKKGLYIYMHIYMYIYCESKCKDLFV
ncbi:hypothetical protein RFI_12434 [Reticulomyxa filosa]|uniref:Uncharacterized protein n=1 Tax=Reticulomyxa filosa TaxID=46433 RepID=X6NFQ0_RETFI|nr:hypothetical protein RFI_12434 [Reticulomyxa filosa]|eukprot:ETO24723.1 hypothetical protein RFI_12434 [Reticulomyxa filosa]